MSWGGVAAGFAPPVFPNDPGHLDSAVALGYCSYSTLFLIAVGCPALVPLSSRLEAGCGRQGLGSSLCAGCRTRSVMEMAAAIVERAVAAAV